MKLYTYASTSGPSSRGNIYGVSFFPKRYVGICVDSTKVFWITNGKRKEVPTSDDREQISFEGAHAAQIKLPRTTPAFYQILCSTKNRQTRGVGYLGDRLSDSLESGLTDTPAASNSWQRERRSRE